MVGTTTVLTFALVKFRKGGIGRLSALPPPTPAATKPTPVVSAGVAAAPAVAAVSPSVVAASHQPTVSMACYLLDNKTFWKLHVCVALKLQIRSLCDK